MRFRVAIVGLENIQVWDEDFGYDAALRITGDFGSYDERMAYANAVAEALNKGDIPKHPASPKPL